LCESAGDPARRNPLPAPWSASPRLKLRNSKLET
jgi:hypothetical protein